MAKRKSNRAARRLLAWGKCHTSFRITNTRVMYHGGNMHFICPYVLRTKPSRNQRRNDKRRFEWLREHASTDCDYIGIADHNPQFHC